MAKRTNNQPWKADMVTRVKREAAQARQAKYDALTVEEKLALCAKRTGESKREVARLMALNPDAKPVKKARSRKPKTVEIASDFHFGPTATPKKARKPRAKKIVKETVES